MNASKHQRLLSRSLAIVNYPRDPFLSSGNSHRLTLPLSLSLLTSSRLTSVCEFQSENEREADNGKAERVRFSPSFPRFCFSVSPLCAFEPTVVRLVSCCVLSKMHIFNKNKRFTVLRWLSMSRQSSRISSRRELSKKL